ncbi:MAG: hypothetical protein M3021_12695 [Actinomycetota bacterium]|nr:hypothetical protein [Actinomycetota bacterium]
MYVAHVIEPSERRGNDWSHTRIGVFRQSGDRKEQVGEYLRNDADRPKTFCPFRRAGKDYALYAPFSTTTRIMALPSCQDFGGEEPHDGGFCPVEFYVPAPRAPQDASLVDHYPFGFVGGCYWMDDYQIQYLDLSRVAEGIVVRDQRTGYIPWLNNRRVAHHISLAGYAPPEAPIIAVLTATRFDVRTGTRIPGEGFEDPQPDQPIAKDDAKRAEPSLLHQK